MRQGHILSAIEDSEPDFGTRVLLMNDSPSHIEANGTRAGSTSTSVYHEKQSRWRCGIHAVNAILKGPVYAPSDFDTIADSLLVQPRWPWSHPHRSVFGMGEYDVNVLLVALEKRNIVGSWMRDRNLSTILSKLGDDVCGFLVNVESKHWARKFVDHFASPARHWVAVVKYEDKFHLVDSKAAAAIALHSEEDLETYLQEVWEEKGHILLLEKDRSDNILGA